MKLLNFLISVHKQPSKYCELVIITLNKVVVCRMNDYVHDRHYIYEILFKSPLYNQSRNNYRVERRNNVLHECLHHGIAKILSGEKNRTKRSRVFTEQRANYSGGMERAQISDHLVGCS